MNPGRLLAALDKFKGTATSSELGAAVAGAARAQGWTAQTLTLSDGGEGLLEVFGGPNRHADVVAPDGRTVSAAWRSADNGTAVIESARASGLALVGGGPGNDPVAATSRGTGQLVEVAVQAGARRVVLGLGGSATTDGGTGALEALSPSTVDRLRSGAVELQVCCDVTTRFVDAATVFGPQKGANREQVRLLTDRLAGQQDDLRARFGVELADLPGGGAAGGLGGAFAAVGGLLRPGFDVVAEHVHLDDAVARADLVVTGEGCLDGSSFAGKVVGGVVTRATRLGVGVLIVAGRVEGGLPPQPGSVQLRSLVEAIGEHRATTDTANGVAEVVGAVLAG
jgi:glycerate 2-kinase